MRNPVIAGNWKMNMTVSETSEFVCEFLKRLKDFPDRVEVMLFPPFTSLSVLSTALRSSSVKVGGQNMHWASGGAYTGEISGKMLKDSGCECVIIGHSERRGQEDNLTINKKLHSAFSENLRPLLCVGETLEERESGSTLTVIETQLSECLQGFDRHQIVKLLIAYEPVWAIGTGQTALPDSAQEVHKQIREWVEGKFGIEAARNISILYGGSVKPENASDLLCQEDIDGALVGGASLKVHPFCDIINAIKNI